MVLLPWLRDYLGRSKLERMRRISTADSLAALQARIVARRRRWLDDPKSLDLWLTILGFLLIAGSFVIGVWLTS